MRTVFSFAAVLVLLCGIASAQVVTFPEVANNGLTTLDGDITDAATTISVTSASALGVTGSTTDAYVTIVDRSTWLKHPEQTPEVSEIVKITSVSGNDLTVTRAQDGTSAKAFSDGDIVQMRVIAAHFDRVYNALTDGTDTINVGQVNIAGSQIASSDLSDGPFGGGGAVDFDDDIGILWGTDDDFESVYDGTDLRYELRDGAGNEMFHVTDGGTTGTLDVTGQLNIAGDQINSGDLSDVASIAMLDEAETIAANWVNTANPWADNEVANTLTLTGGSIDGVPIGATTPAAGTFTTLDTTGTVDVGGFLTVGDGAGFEQILLDGAAGNARDLSFASSGSSRWIWRVTASAEGGGNTGSAIQLVSRDDAGQFLDTPINIGRPTTAAIDLQRDIVTTGDLTVNGGDAVIGSGDNGNIGTANDPDKIALNAVGIGGVTINDGLNVIGTGGATIVSGDGAGFESVEINGGAGNGRAVVFLSNGTRRWDIRANSDGESGSDAGSNIQIDAYDDAGNFIDAPIAIGRASSGVIDLARDVDVGGGLAVNEGSAFADGDTTPSVAGGNIFKLGAQTSPISVTALDDGTAGQIVTLIAVDGDTTLTDASTLNLGGAWSPNADDTMMLVYDGTNWFEISRSAN